MKHLTYLSIAAGVFIFTKLYADAISFNSIEVSGMNLVEQLFIIAFVTQWVAYIPAFVLKTEKFYDLTGSLTYIITILFALYATDSFATLQPGNLLIGTAIMIWAIRLGSFLFLRIAKDGKDNRFNSIKVSFSQFFMTWTIQGMWVFVCSSAAFVAMASSTGVVINGVFIIGLVMFIFGFAVEVLADNQKPAFRSIPENKDQFINAGLWARSRHPNYFFEWLHWWTYLCLAWGSPLWWIAAAGVVVMLLFLTKITGIPTVEAQAVRSRGDAYREYQRTTSGFFPWPPATLR